ncbi:hypothetical protein FK529_05580 [Tsukamurella asaccharolytica]|uniref:Uncharacterized protein n=1 Tax=Tsukamurella asaccharolytica TaxID=2592067 RepID=A0A5C5RED1_9ACTN|nr:hypothetical protein [Tsukamurella asaccharolytica]TWS20793.1 hypothetical protein FK529_05580 [Tsukamurella asaccharolytica]
MSVALTGFGGSPMVVSATVRGRTVMSIWSPLRVCRVANCTGGAGAGGGAMTSMNSAISVAPRARTMSWRSSSAGTATMSCALLPAMGLRRAPSRMLSAVVMARRAVRLVTDAVMAGHNFRSE